jgi:hypothetical protein
MITNILFRVSYSRNSFKHGIVSYKTEGTMATDNMNARKEDKENINVHDPLELRYWSNKLGVTKESILEAVREAGDSIDEVEKYIKDKHIRIVKNN